MNFKAENNEEVKVLDARRNVLLVHCGRAFAYREHLAASYANTGEGKLFVHGKEKKTQKTDVDIQTLRACTVTGSPRAPFCLQKPMATFLE